MVEHRGIARAHLGSRDPHVLGEVGLHEDVLVVDGASRRQLERLRHLDDDVGLDVPPAVERERSRRVGLVAGRRSRIGPRVERRDLTIDEAALVGKVADRRIGKPWRHLPAGHCGLDGARPGPRLLVGEERHRRHFAGPMTALTIGLENREHVLVESRRFGGRQVDAPNKEPTTAIRHVLIREVSSESSARMSQYTAKAGPKSCQFATRHRAVEFTQMSMKLCNSHGRIQAMQLREAVAGVGNWKLGVSVVDSVLRPALSPFRCLLRTLCCKALRPLNSLPDLRRLSGAVAPRILILNRTTSP